MNRIDGKVAVVTGGTQGLGAAVARLFARAGAAGIVIVGRDAQKGQARAQAITQDTGVPVHMVAANLADMEDVRGIMAQADRIGALQTALEKDRLSTLLQIRARLTPEQRAAMTQSLERRKRHRRPGGPRGGPEGPGRPPSFGDP